MSPMPSMWMGASRGDRRGSTIMRHGSRQSNSGLRNTPRNGTFESVIVIDPETQRIAQYKNGDLLELAGTVQQLGASRCSIDWKKVEELLD